MKVLCSILWITIIFTEIKYSQCLNEKLQEYFESDCVKTCSELWSKHRTSIEKAVEKVLKEYTGSKILNVHQKYLNDTLHVTNGIIIRDGAVDLLLQDLHIRQLPRFLFSQVYLDVPSHVLRLDMSLTRLHLDANYEINKNESTYKTSENGPLASSPFSAQEVSAAGQVAIVADHCHFISISVVKLNREYVNLGFGTPKLANCKFSIEIFKPGSSSPPVFAPYFSAEEVELMQDLLATPIYQKLEPLIQGTLVSYINTSAIFGEHLAPFREAQEKIFALTSDYMEKSATELNKIAARDTVPHKLSPYKSSSDSSAGHSHVVKKCVTIDGATIHGLDSVYSAHSGGPYKLDNIRIGEALRFSTLQVRGNLEYKVGEDAYKNGFISTIKDFEVHLTLNQDGKTSRRTFIYGNLYLNYLSGFNQILPEHQDPLKEYTKYLLSAYVLHSMPEGLNALSEALTTVFGPVITDDPQSAAELEADDDDDEANGPESLADDVVAANDIESADDGIAAYEAAGDGAANYEAADDGLAAYEAADDGVAVADIKTA